MKKTFAGSASSFAVKLLIRALLIFWALMIIFPVIWMFYTSMKTSGEFMTNQWALPSEIRFDNYVTAWKAARFSTYFVNSLFIAIVATALHLAFVSTTSYALVKYDFFGKKFLNSFYFAAIMIPAALTLIPLYMQVYSINPGLPNNRLTLCVIYAAQAIPMNTFLLTKFVGNINNAILESAEIDGANEYQKFFYIVLPSIKTMLVFIMITNAIGNFNEYTTALTFLKENKYTIAVGINSIRTEAQISNEYGLVFASIVLLLLPVLTIYTVFQGAITKGIDMSEGVKG